MTNWVPNYILDRKKYQDYNDGWMSWSRLHVYRMKPLE